MRSPGGQMAAGGIPGDQAVNDGDDPDAVREGAEDRGGADHNPGTRGRFPADRTSPERPPNPLRDHCHNVRGPKRGSCQILCADDQLMVKLWGLVPFRREGGLIQILAVPWELAV